MFILIQLFEMHGARRVKSYFQPKPLSEVLTVTDIQHAASRSELAQNLNSHLSEWGYGAVITTKNQIKVLHASTW